MKNLFIYGRAIAAPPPGNSRRAPLRYRHLMRAAARLIYYGTRWWSVADREAQPETAVRGRCGARVPKAPSTPSRGGYHMTVGVNTAWLCLKCEAPSFTVPSARVLLYATRLVQICSAPREQRQVAPVSCSRTDMAAWRPALTMRCCPRSRACIGLSPC